MDFSNLSSKQILTPVEQNFRVFNWLYQSKILNFNMELQTQSNWCWAATSKSVSHFYGRFLNPWTQCKIASSELGQTCCTSPVPGPCNVPWYLDRALARTQNFVSFGGQMSWSDVKAQVDQGLVVGTRIGWSGGGGHFMVIYGVSKILNTEYFHIDDPIYGKSILTVSQFSNNYQGSGSWTHSYHTKKHSYLMWLKDLVVKAEWLKPIPEFRPILKMQYPQLEVEKNASEIQLSFPHFTYNIGLKEIGRDMDFKREPASVRVFEFEQEQPIALYDLSTDDANPELIQANTNRDYIGKVERSVVFLKENLKERREEGELKLLKFPALNAEALWINYEGSKDDHFYFVRGFDVPEGILDQGSFNETLNKLKENAERQDEMMGA
jgi:hypothetical protein